MKLEFQKEKEKEFASSEKSFRSSHAVQSWVERRKEVYYFLFSLLYVIYFL